MFHPPPSWTNQPIRLFHGTTAAHATSITTSGVRVSASRTRIDWGFYTTTTERQARSWAWEIVRKFGGMPAVVSAEIDRDALAALDSLTFVRGDFDDEDFWSFVTHCRSGGTDHARRRRNGRSYDLVTGPVAAAWRQRTLIASSDQISFHTRRAERVLNSVEWRIFPWGT